MLDATVAVVGLIVALVLCLLGAVRSVCFKLRIGCCALVFVRLLRVMLVCEFEFPGCCIAV